MTIEELFRSGFMALPRTRTFDDFETYLKNTLEEYYWALHTLDPACHLSKGIKDSKEDVKRLNEQILSAVHTYLGGQPAAAYKELEVGIDFVYARLQQLLSLDLEPQKFGPLYRMGKLIATPPSREHIFHVPFDLRHRVSQHRYGIPGFPCLYLGGCLELCKAELRVTDSDLPDKLVAEFAPNRQLKVLDFGIRPETLARVAEGRAMGSSTANPKLQKFLIDYAICWPLLAASSIKVYNEGCSFLHEYIVPQMILQWAMKRSECDGIRYFSTRYLPDPDAIHRTANYVFPAIKDAVGGSKFSQTLVDTFELTEPAIWGALKSSTISEDAVKKEFELHSLPKATL